MAITQPEYNELAGRGYLTLLKKTVVLTDDQIKGMSVAIELVPAPGTNKINVFNSAIILKSQDFVSYQDISPDALVAIGYEPSNPTYDFISCFFKDTGQFGAQLTNLIGGSGIGSVDHFFVPVGLGSFLTGYGYQAQVVRPDPRDKPIKIGLMDNGGDLTGGDPANTLTVSVIYSVVDIP